MLVDLCDFSSSFLKIFLLYIFTEILFNISNISLLHSFLLLEASSDSISSYHFSCNFDVLMGSAPIWIPLDTIWLTSGLYNPRGEHIFSFVKYISKVYRRHLELCVK